MTTGTRTCDFPGIPDLYEAVFSTRRHANAAGEKIAPRALREDFPVHANRFIRA